MYPPAGLAYQERAMVYSSYYWAGDVIVPQLAQPVYESLAVLRASGTVTLHRPDPALGELRPGRVWDLAGAPALAGCQAITQTVTTDLNTERVTLTMGLPRQLGVKDLEDLRKWVKIAFYT